MHTPETLLSQLRIDLLRARKSRDSLTSATLQALIGAIDNAGAVPVPANMSTIGAGSTERPRRILSTQDIQEIVSHEIIELQHALKEFGSTKSAYTNELNNRITILAKYL